MKKYHDKKPRWVECSAFLLQRSVGYSHIKKKT